MAQNLIIHNYYTKNNFSKLKELEGLPLEKISIVIQNLLKGLSNDQILLHKTEELINISITDSDIISLFKKDLLVEENNVCFYSVIIKNWLTPQTSAIGTDLFKQLTVKDKLIILRNIFRVLCRKHDYSRDEKLYQKAAKALLSRMNISEADIQTVFNLQGNFGFFKRRLSCLRADHKVIPNRNNTTHAQLVWRKQLSARRSLSEIKSCLLYISISPNICEKNDDDCLYGFVDDGFSFYFEISTNDLKIFLIDFSEIF